MSGYTKLSASLVASSIWNEPDDVRIVWITLLALADAEGNVRASVVGLAHLARKTSAETREALKTLAAPDPESNCQDEEGRRITPIEGGWHLVTHSLYRTLGMSEENKQYWKDQKRKQRSVSKNVPDSPGHVGQSGTPGDGYGCGIGQDAEKEEKDIEF